MQLITLGQWGNEPIQWREIPIPNVDHSLFIADKVIDCKPFQDTAREPTFAYDYWSTDWSVCSLRKWLNTEFYETAFNEFEKQRIVERATGYLCSSGIEQVDDRVSCLSSFYLDYMEEDSLIGIPTRHAIARGAFVDEACCGYYWWLCDQALRDDCALIVTREGKLYERGDMVHMNFGVRPTIAIRE